MSAYFAPLRDMQFVLRELVGLDEMARLPDQHGENIEGFRRQPDDMVTTQQLALPHVECEITETKGFSLPHQISANLSKTFGTTGQADRYRERLSKGTCHGTDD